MIAKKYTDNNDNPALKVLASSAGRQWVGTETALDAALAAGTIKPGTVADTYMELDEPTVDYATVEYVRKNNKLSPFEVVQTIPATTMSFPVTPNTSTQMFDPVEMLYDGYCIVLNNASTYGNVQNIYLIVQASDDMGQTWHNMSYMSVATQYGMPVDTVLTGVPVLFPVIKGQYIRFGYIGTLQTGGTVQPQVGGVMQCMFYKERDYSE